MNNSPVLFHSLEPWLKLKAEEFRNEGYPHILVEDLWNYLNQFCWKRDKPSHYYQQVSQVMRMSPNDYLDYASLEAQVFKVVSLDEMDINDLL